MNIFNDPLFIWKKNGSGEIVLNLRNEAARQIFPSGELIMPGLTLGDFSRQFFEITKMIEDTFETGQKLRKEMQVEFTVQRSGKVVSVRFYKD